MFLALQLIISVGTEPLEWPAKPRLIHQVDGFVGQNLSLM